jgi:nitrate/nitrite transporter NarK
MQDKLGNRSDVTMSVRERFSWVLSALTPVYGLYFGAVLLLRSQGEIANLTEFGLLSAAALAQAIILGAGALLMRARSGRGDRAKPDERDRAIEHRATTAAYYVLIAGMIVVGCVMPFSHNGWEIVRAAVLAIVIAELVHHGLVVRAYRSGWQA